MKRKLLFVFVLFCLLQLNSCARAPIRTAPPPSPPIGSTGPTTTIPSVPGVRQNLIHIVAPGETAWRISKMYDVSIKEIVKANRLANEKSLKIGQRLSIPRAAPVRPVISLYSSNKWEYIIVHHSATDYGNSLNFDKSHHDRGFNRGLGYHFVINNGKSGKPDGQIEVSPRWLKQLDGAHCKANRMNCRGIGICLVGNFSQSQVSRKQLEALTYLVNRLRKYYKIPKKNVVGHGMVKGATTECPGKNFPWTKFRNSL